MTRFLTLTLAASATLLTACGPFPDARMLSIRRAPAPVSTPALPPGRPATEAETACLEAGRAAGFDGMRLAGTAEVTDAQGVPVSRDVMIAVRRGGQSFEVRCSYSDATSAARIMTL